MSTSSIPRLALLRLALAAILVVVLGRDILDGWGDPRATEAWHVAALLLALGLATGRLVPLWCMALSVAMMYGVTPGPDVGSQLLATTLLGLACWPLGNVAAQRLALVAFGAVALDGGVRHALDPSWHDGTALAWLALSPRTNVVADLAIWIYRQAPLAFGWATIAATWTTVAWEVLFLPLVLWRRTRPFAIWWGVGFFLMAGVVVGLRVLATFGLALWAFLFWVRPAKGDISSRALLAPVVLVAVALASLALHSPLLVGVPGIAPFAALSAEWLARPARLVGVGPVDVFNTAQLRGVRRDVVATWPDGSTLAPATEATAARDRVAVFVLLVTRPGVMAPACGTAEDEAALAPSVARDAPSAGPYTVMWRWRVLPSADDLRRGEYVEPRWVDACRTSP